MRRNAASVLDNNGMYKYECLGCGGALRKKLCEDLPGYHSYVWSCVNCFKEYGIEWVEYHHPTSQQLSEAPLFWKPLHNG